MEKDGAVDSGVGRLWRLAGELRLAAEALFLMYDGHGSTRALLNSTAGVIHKHVVNGVPIQPQAFAYDAYGNMIGNAAAFTTSLGTQPRCHPPDGTCRATMANCDIPALSDSVT
jgi:hypothetical protein